MSTLVPQPDTTGVAEQKPWLARVHLYRVPEILEQKLFLILEIVLPLHLSCLVNFKVYVTEWCGLFLYPLHPVPPMMTYYYVLVCTLRNTFLQKEVIQN